MDSQGDQGTCTDDVSENLAHQYYMLLIFNEIKY